jgi:hypothetical protein
MTSPIMEPPRLRDRVRRSEQRSPSTLGGVGVHGLLRLGLAVGLASGVAYGISAAAGRGPAFGFYLVGAILFAVAVGSSTRDRTRFYYLYSAEGHERRVSMSLAYILAGAIVVGIGVAIEALTR